MSYDKSCENCKWLYTEECDKRAKYDKNDYLINQEECFEKGIPPWEATKKNECNY